MAEYINKKDLIDFIKDTRQRLGHPNVGRYCPNCGAKMGDDK